MDLSEWIAIGGLVAGVALVFTGLIFAHYRNKLTTPAGRAGIAAQLRGERFYVRYTGLLSSALSILRKIIGTPFSVHSFVACCFLAVCYVLLSAFAGWGGGGSGRIGDLSVFRRPEWVTADIGGGWVAAGAAASFIALAIIGYGFVRCGVWPGIALNRRGMPWLGALVSALGLALAVIVALGLILVAGMLLAISGVHARSVPSETYPMHGDWISGADEGALTFLLFWLALPLINTASDYLSLGFSHWFGRRIVEDSGHSIIRASLYGLADLGLALAFMVVAAATIPMALGLLQWATAADLGVHVFVTEAAADPWGAGLWFGIMILTTLVWTGAHLLITLGAILFRLYDGAFLDRWAATMIETGKDSVLVKLYLSSKWLVVFLLWCLLVYVFFLLLNGSVHAITALSGSDKGLIGVLEAVALWGAGLVPLPSEFRPL